MGGTWYRSWYPASAPSALNACLALTRETSTVTPHDFRLAALHILTFLHSRCILLSMARQFGNGSPSLEGTRSAGVSHRWPSWDWMSYDDTDKHLTVKVR